MRDLQNGELGVKLSEDHHYWITVTSKPVKISTFPDFSILPICLHYPVITIAATDDWVVKKGREEITSLGS